MKMSKKFFAITVVIAMLFVLCSCTADEKAFMANFYNDKLNSYISTGTLDIELNAVVPDEVKEEMKPFNLQSLMNALSDFKLAWGETTSLKDNKINSKLTYGVSSPEFSYVSDMYVYTEDNDLIYAFDIPTIFKVYLPEEYENAETAYYSYNELTEQANIPVSLNIEELTAKSREIQKEMVSFLTKYTDSIKDFPKLIQKSGRKYTLTLSDEQLKNIIKSFVEAYCTNEKARKSANEFAASFLELYKTMYTEEYYEMLFGGFYEAIDNISQDDLNAFYEQFTSYFEAFKSIRLLGNKGIKISYEFDSNGYIREVGGTIDFMIDVSNISLIADGMEYSSDFYINGVIKYEQEFTKINQVTKKDVFDKALDNSIPLWDWIEAYTPSYEADYEYEYDYFENHISNAVLPRPDGVTALYNYGDEILLEGFTPKMIDGTLYAPLEQLLKDQYFDFYWNAEMGEMAVTDYIRNYYIKPNSNKIYSDGYSITLDKNVILIDDFMYVPFRSFSNAVLGQPVYYNAELNFAGLGTEDYYYLYINEEN